MGDLGIPPICLSTFPDGLLVKILERWRGRAGAEADGAILPISVKIVHRRYRRRGARTRPPLLSAVFRAAGRSLRGRRQSVGRHPRICRLQPDVCQSAQDDRSGRARAVPGFEPGRQPPRRICRRIDTLMSLGFNYFMVSSCDAGHAAGRQAKDDGALRRRNLSALFQRDAQGQGGMSTHDRLPRRAGRRRRRCRVSPTSSTPSRKSARSCACWRRIRRCG